MVWVAMGVGRVTEKERWGCRWGDVDEKEGMRVAKQINIHPYQGSDIPHEHQEFNQIC